jgi:hypothetical protein
MICTTVVRGLVLATALAAALTPVRCLGEDVNPLPAKATKEPPRELLTLIKQKKMPKFSDPYADFQGRSRTRGLEALRLLP